MKKYFILVSCFCAVLVVFSLYQYREARSLKNELGNSYSFLTINMQELMTDTSRTDWERLLDSEGGQEVLSRHLEDIRRFNVFGNPNFQGDWYLVDSEIREIESLLVKLEETHELTATESEELESKSYTLSRLLDNMQHTESFNWYEAFKNPESNSSKLILETLSSSDTLSN